MTFQSNLLSPFIYEVCP